MTALPTAVTKKGSGWDQVWVTTNELGQKEVLKALAAEKLRGNAIMGCSGVYVLNMASVCDGIEHIAAFDISEKVQALWEGMQKFIPTLDPDKFEEAQKKFCSWIRTEYSRQEARNIELEIREGVSFFSSPTQFKRVWKIFCDKKATFTKVDFTQPKEFLTFIMGQKAKGVIPHAVYVSNIAETSSGPDSNPTGMELCTHWDNMRRSLSLIPKEAIVIDAKGTNVKGVMEDTLQRIHLKERDDLNTSLETLFRVVCTFNEYEPVAWCIGKGADANMLIDTGSRKFTVLARAANRGNLNTALALLDQEANVNVRDSENSTTLIDAACRDRTELIELLVSRKADVDAAQDDGMAALHQAAALGKLKAAQALLEFGGANHKAKDRSRKTPFDYTLDPGTPCYKNLRGTEEYTTLQALLKNGCKRKEPRKFTAPTPPATPATTTARAESKESSEKVETKKN